jgi:hypothetical protein
MSLVCITNYHINYFLINVNFFLYIMFKIIIMYLQTTFIWENKTMKFPTALMQKANELNHHVYNLDTYQGGDLNKAKLLQHIIYHAKELLIHAVNETSDCGIEYLISGIENMDEDGELNDIIDSLTEIENDKELSDWEEHSTMNKNGTGCK